jgi:hypothetical protein
MEATTMETTTVEATTVTGLDDMAGQRRVGDHCRLSHNGIGHGRWCGGDG